MAIYDKLRDYQQQDVQFALTLPAVALFNEQRTGKTPTALAILEQKNCIKNLIVCPASAVYQWVDEYETWMEQPCLACIGTPAKRQQIINSWTHGLVISYDMLKQVTKKEKIYGELPNILAAQPEAVVLDEAHRIRNPKTATCKAAFSLSKIPYRMALTGTPAPNKAHEVWAILHFLYPKTFSSFWKFIGEYFVSSRQSNPMGNVYIDIGPPTQYGELVLKQILRRIATNRKRKEVMTWLPDKDYIKVRLPLTAEQKRYLNELEEMYETEDIITIGVLDRLIRYRQICLDPGLLDLKGSSPKTEWLIQYSKDYPERPTLVFSKFTSYIHRLSAKFPEAGVIVGATPSARRRELCKDFQSGKIKLLFLNTDAGKEALTLDTAEAVIFMDKYPPVGDIAQAEDRFVSTTPDKADKPHLIYDLIMKGSYEVEVHRMIAERFSETDVINNYRKHLERRKAHGNRSNLP